MTTLVKVNKNFQITLPARLRERLPLAEGDYLEASISGTSFTFKPKTVADRDPSQAWYWTPQWQKAEREAEDDIKHGRVTYHENMADLIADLKKHSKKA